ncbi:hypothetical protein [Rhizohabitans arisaemae]|uniref:hypothetical protein n=1 Tax=Rhizohabitans arisaemae TaxID=2720610 RepID=UPI0024B13D8B|nr:hypothetical protein [Rhizohabitans arisaemae]
MGTSATHAHAAPLDPGSLPTPGIDDRSVLVKQARVTKVAERIVKAAEALPGDSGYSGIRTDPANSRFTLYWHGKVPAGVREAAESDPGVEVSVMSAAFSLRTLKKAQKAVSDQNPPGRRVNGLSPIVSVAPAVDGSGLEVAIEAVKGVTTPQSLVETQRWFGTVTGEVPVTVTETTRPVATGRHDGQAHGGARFVVSGRTCTQGFSLWAWGSWSYMLTAGHCAAEGWTATQPQPSAPYAHVVQREVNYDTELLMPSHGTSQSFFTRQIWWGGPYEHSLRANVAGTAAHRSGDRVCASGGFSGVHCDVIIDNPDAFMDFENPLPPFGRTRVWDVAIVMASGPDNPVWGEGDSGSPVVTYDGNTAGNVYANGIISIAFGNIVDCRGIRGRKCWNRGAYARLDRYLARNPSFQLRTW